MHLFTLYLDSWKVLEVLKHMFGIMVSPVIILVWLIGWALYVVGNRTPSSSLRKSQVYAAKNPFEIMTIIDEELLMATDEP
jgi:hypothetical protein